LEDTGDWSARRRLATVLQLEFAARQVEATRAPRSRIAKAEEEPALGPKYLNQMWKAVVEKGYPQPGYQISNMSELLQKLESAHVWPVPGIRFETCS